eukprot:GHVT01089577.1.p1 GENE.GHVT01089577.1~~GHVT01089577.1.p1  ORF type:complete len:186 (-),score=25.91 GHVT01089577.1:129-686(-)
MSSSCQQSPPAPLACDVTRALVLVSKHGRLALEDGRLELMGGGRGPGAPPGGCDDKAPYEAADDYSDNHMSAMKINASAPQSRSPGPTINGAGGARNEDAGGTHEEPPLSSQASVPTDHRQAHPLEKDSGASAAAAMEINGGQGANKDAGESRGMRQPNFDSKCHTTQTNAFGKKNTLLCNSLNK